MTDSKQLKQNEAAMEVYKPVPPKHDDIGAMLETALASGTSPDDLGKLVDLYERMHDRDAKAAFNKAMIAFQEECPQIPRATKADVVTRKGAKFNYNYADLETIDKIVRPFLSKHGLSRRWGDAKLEGGNIRVAFIVAHLDGHSETTWSLPVPTTTDAGMSDAQKFGSSFNYGKRQVMIAGLGLTTCDPDDDGSGGPSEFVAITQSQELYIEDMIASYSPSEKEHNVNRARFLKWLGADSVAKIPANRYQQAIDALKKKGAK